MKGFYDFLKKRVLFVFFAFCINIIIFSFTQQEYNIGPRTPESLIDQIPKKEAVSEEEIVSSSETNNITDSRFHKALKDYNQSIRLKPSEYAAYYNRGLTYFKMKEYEKALSDFKKADVLSFQKDVEVKNNMGITYSKIKDYDQAILVYDQAINLDPTNYKPYNNKGIALNKMGKPQEALKSFNKAIALNPIESKLYNNKGVSLSQLNLYVKAIEEYNKSLKLNPYNNKAYNNRGIALSKLEKEIND